MADKDTELAERLKQLTKSQCVWVAARASARVLPILALLPDYDMREKATVLSFHACQTAYAYIAASKAAAESAVTKAAAIIATNNTNVNAVAYNINIDPTVVIAAKTVASAKADAIAAKADVDEDDVGRQVLDAAAYRDSVAKAYKANIGVSKAEAVRVDALATAATKAAIIAAAYNAATKTANATTNNVDVADVVADAINTANRTQNEKRFEYLVYNDIEFANYEDISIQIRPLWPNGAMPDDIAVLWSKLKTGSNSDPSFQYWIKWYEARLKGNPIIWDDITQQQVCLTTGQLKATPSEVNLYLWKLEQHRFALSAKIGVATGFDITRESKGNLKLGFDNIALAIAHVMRNAEDEFSMALLGDWGCGKTTLVREALEPLLTDPQKFREKLKDPHSQKMRANRLKYDVVWFSAWKYPHTPETWAYLYETFVKGMLKADILTRSWRKIGVILRQQPFFRGLFLAPLDLIKNESYKNAKDILSKNANLARHGDKLGAQAIIGKDLHALLCGWILNLKGTPQKVRSRAFQKSVRKNIKIHWKRLLLAVIFFVATCLFTRYIPNQTQTYLSALFSEQIAFLFDRVATFLLIAWLGLLLLMGAFRLCGFLFEKTNRILLVVDDLDRCKPEETIEILDALKLFIDNEPDIASRVQVLALIDECALGMAIQNKFKELVTYKMACNMLEQADSIHREHLEKLFLCTLRLPPRTEKDTSDLLNRFLHRKPKKQKASLPASTQATSDGNKSTSIQQQTETTEKGSQNKPSTNNEATGSFVVTPSEPKPLIRPKPSFVAVAFDDEEKEYLYETVCKESKYAEKNLSPRAIKALLTRYQLARALLQTKENPIAIDETRLNILATILTRGALGVDTGNILDEDTKKILEMVLQDHLAEQLSKPK
jgi:hypothetical protein